MRGRQRNRDNNKKKRKSKRKGENKRKKGGGEEVGRREGDCTSYLREECTRGHILHFTAVACPMFNSLSHSLCKISNITQHTSGATDHIQTYVIH